MSTLTIATPRTTSDVDSRFDALVRIAVPAQRGRHEVTFETLFDLDYGQRAITPISAAPAVRTPRTAREARPVAVRRAKAAPRAVRLTRRGRTVLVLAFLGLALAAMTVFGGWATATLSGGTPEPTRVIEVAPGDTLYDIAADLAQPGEIRSMVHRIQELNSLPGASITEGQKLAVPRG